MGGEPAKLYVIHGSHACRSAMLMLEHKGLAYRTVVLRTGPHPLLLRAHGFAGHPSPIRRVEGSTPAFLGLLDRGGTVPALRSGPDRVQTNHDIARYLDREFPERPLLPLDQDLRGPVEDAESWADDELQMTARRIALATAARGLDAVRNRGAEGRLGALLAANQPERVVASRVASLVFHAGGGSEAELLATVPGMLDRVDEWIAEGVLGGAELNVADFMVAPSLALLGYRADLDEQIHARPCGALLDRVLPEPHPR